MAIYSPDGRTCTHLLWSRLWTLGTVALAPSGPPSSWLQNQKVHNAVSLQALGIQGQGCGERCPNAFCMRSLEVRLCSSPLLLGFWR